MTNKPRLVAFIPARSGSKRILDKNIRKLGEHPLIAYSIQAAIHSDIFDSVICATDSEHYAEIARHYGAEVPFLRPNDISEDTSPDIEWVSWMIKLLSSAGRTYDVFSILRPTSPFRLPETIRRAWESFKSSDGIDSLRAVEACQQHPGKMWVVRQNRLLPLLPLSPDTQPWHSSQYAALPKVYVQNASLEMAWTRVVLESNTIAGSVMLPFFTDQSEGLDVNSEFDWWKAERLISNGVAKLPDITITPWHSI